VDGNKLHDDVLRDDVLNDDVLNDDVLHDLYSSSLKKSEEEEVGGSCGTIGAIMLLAQFFRKTEQKGPRVESCTSVVGQD